MRYDIRDINLAPYGHTKIEWVRNNMPLLNGLEEEFLKTKPFEGVKYPVAGKTGTAQVITIAQEDRYDAKRIHYVK